MLKDKFNTNESLKFIKLSIKNFKVFKNFEISFTDKNDEPLPLIVIAGVNGSGKTTILDALGKYPKDELNNNEKNIKLDYILDKNGILIENDNITKKELKNYINYSSIEHSLFNIFKEYVPEYIYKLLFARNIVASEIYKELSQYIIDIFKDMDLKIIFSRVSGDKKLFFKNKQGQEFSIDDISTGEKALLSTILYLYLLDIKGQVILVDEPETYIHPNWQNKILKLYENFAIKNNCQIIIATHSPQIIGSAKNEYLRVLTDDENGNIKVIDNFSECYGLEVNQVLTEIMGVKYLRTPDISKKFTDIHNMIVNNEFDNDDFKIKWQELEDLLGKNYLDLKLLKLEIISRKKNV